MEKAFTSPEGIPLLYDLQLYGAERKPLFVCLLSQGQQPPDYDKGDAFVFVRAPGARLADMDVCRAVAALLDFIVPKMGLKPSPSGETFR